MMLIIVEFFSKRISLRKPSARVTYNKPFVECAQTRQPQECICARNVLHTEKMLNKVNSQK